MLDYENQFYSKEVNFIVGTDEAGRGCLLGPVVAAAVILPRDFSSDLINDSKKLSPKQREKAYDLIIERALSWATYEVSAEQIDKINILEASRLAMEEAIHKLKHSYDLVLTDCMNLFHIDKPYISLVKGDAKCQCIAAASIIAKVTRDRICENLDKLYPNYHIAKHKGYGTKEHLDALQKYGPIPHIHRFSYKPIKELLTEKITLF